MLRQRREALVRGLGQRLLSRVKEVGVGALAATADAVWGSVVDLVIANRRVTDEVGHHMLVLGLWVWASSMFAGYAVFGHRRPLNAVVLIGILLNGLTMLNVPYYAQDIVKGGVFIVALAFAFIQRRGARQ